VLLPGSLGGHLQGLAQVQLIGPDLIVDQGAAGIHIERIRLGETNVQAFAYQTMITPMKAGKVSFFAQGFTTGPNFVGTITGPIVVQAGPPQYTLLESEPIELSVRSLPREGELPGFTGAIGSFGLGAVTLESNVLRAGDPVKISVTITNRGETNLARLVPPPP